MRVGLGYDAHPFVEGRDLFLGGVPIAHEKGLKGHSDADVLLHAICDALLGASGQGDMGRFFPDTDPAFKNKRSDFFLLEVQKILNDKNLSVDYIDCIVICEKPKLGPFFEEIRTKISEILSLDAERINIKAKTNEGMGFTGRKEGIAAYAITSLKES